MNLKKLVREILDTGMSQEDLAKQIGSITGNKRFSQATVSRIKDGASTSFTVGEAITKVHDKVTQQKAA